MEPLSDVDMSDNKTKSGLPQALGIYKAPPKQTKREANQTRDAFGKMRGAGGRTPVQQASFLERKRIRLKMADKSNTPEYKELGKQISKIVKTFNLSPTIGRQTLFMEKNKKKKK